MNIYQAKTYIYQNARPLDYARWQYLFENGSQENVLKALQAYQNEDGGFGHGLEIDCWNPFSSPVQTWAATKIMKEVHLEDASHPLIQGVLRYLQTTEDFDGHVWFNAIHTNNDYPHAPWWDDHGVRELNYNPTASLIGFIIKYGNSHSEIYQKACCLLKEAYQFLKDHYPLESMHTVSCFVELFEYLKECDYQDIDLLEFEMILKKQIQEMLTQDVSLWSVEYVCKPSLFIQSKESVFYKDNKDLCDLECDFISKTQEDDGTWKITWNWENYPEQWAVSKNWWKCDMIIQQVKFLKAMQEGEK